MTPEQLDAVYNEAKQLELAAERCTDDIDAAQGDSDLVEFWQGARHGYRRASVAIFNLGHRLREMNDS